MTPEEDYNKQQPHQAPICPHCGRGAKNKDSCILAGSGIMLGGFPFIVITCAGCHKIVTVCPMPMPPGPPPQQQPRSSLIIPS